MSTNRNHTNHKHYGYDDLPWLLTRYPGWRRAELELKEGESAMQPGSTKHVIWGPCVVTYTQAPDGGIDHTVKEVTS